MAEGPDRVLARRTLLRGLLLGAAGVAGLSGVAACGIPGSGKPHIDGDGPTSAGQNDGSADHEPPSPGSTSDPHDFVRTFLTAIAGPADEASREAAVENVRSFLTPAAQKQLQVDSKQVTVVRVVAISKPAFSTSTTKVTVDLVPVGQLTSGGSVSPVLGSQARAEFNLVRNDSDPSANTTWHIDAPLPAPFATSLVLSSEGLAALYQPQLIYFWDAPNGAGLVPDLRYLPSVGLKHEAQPTQIVNWLVGGPSTWLLNAVSPLPGSTVLQPGNVVKDPKTGIWVVDFATLQDVDLAHVAAQLRWSLEPRFTTPIRLRIAGQDRAVDFDKYEDSNLANTPSRAADPVGYFVVNGQVRRSDAPNDIPPVFAGINDTSVVGASLSRDRRLGALVHSQKNSAYALSIGQLAGDSGADFRTVNLGAGKITSLSRPVWLPAPAPGPRLLVAANNALYTVNVAGEATPVPVESGYERPVSAFAVSPDGRRIALISEAKVMVAPLTYTQESAAVGRPYEIDAGGLQEPSALAWSRVHCLLVGGRLPGEDKYSLVEVSLDGAIASTPVGFGSRITQVASYPPIPRAGLQQPGPIMVQTLNSGSWQVFRDNPLPLRYEPAKVNPSPSGGGAQPPNQNVPSYPFYQD